MEKHAESERQRAAADRRGAALLKANALRLGEAGLLLLGASGAGKSALTVALLERADRSGRGGALVADDYSLLTVSGGAIYAQPPRETAGLLEIRGAGLFHSRYEPRIRLTLAVALSGGGERYPQGHWRSWPELAAAHCGAGEACESQEAGGTGREENAGAAGKEQAEVLLPLLKLPQAGRADITALCHAVEAYLFQRPYQE